MRKQKLALLGLAMIFCQQGYSQAKKGSVLNRGGVAPALTPAATRAATLAMKAAPGPKQRLSEVASLMGNGNYEKAAQLLYVLMRRQEMAPFATRMRYLLGVAMTEMKYYQVAAFQFVHVIKSNDSQYLKPALERLSVAADYLGDETLLNYALSKIQVADFPAAYQDILFFRLGEIKLKNGEFDEALKSFAKVGAQSKYRDQARFKLGLTLLEAQRPLDAIKVYLSMLEQKSNAKVTDVNRVSTILALARSYYQAKKWDESIEFYRKVPRDTEMWHDAMFEVSWAYLQSAKFRSSLSNFQTLHSTYYEEFYLPESLLLRGIIYLYICKYDEMEKVLDLFEKSYGKVRSTIAELINDTKDPIFFFEELERAAQYRKNHGKINFKIPFNAAKHILDEGDVHRSMEYLRLLMIEKNRLEKSTFGKTAIGQYSLKIIYNRLKNSKQTIGELIKDHLIIMNAELGDLAEQGSFARYEMINGRKEQLKKKIAGRSATQQIDEDRQRSFYIQNGYEYWPFKGEYWLDELGSYQYLGKQSCE